MPKFKIITASMSAHEYIVEAENTAEAEEKFNNTDFIEDRPLPSYNIDSQEEILEIDEIK